ncbi:hypothetical protein E4U33_005667 [Claviceps sp. LM78 group G4]|nr:hypothetical protein E4U33_005667 [Claviceps sp. LM78 group G4]
MGLIKGFTTGHGVKDTNGRRTEGLDMTYSTSSGITLGGRHKANRESREPTGPRPERNSPMKLGTLIVGPLVGMKRPVLRWSASVQTHE